MHIVFFNRSYWPDVTATGQLLTELAEDLVGHHGCEVTVVAGYPVRGAGRLPAKESRNGVSIIRAAGTTFDPSRFAGRVANYLSYFASACAAALTLRRPDVVIALTDPPIVGLAALLAARRAAARFVFLCQDVFPEVARLLEDFHNEAMNAALDRVNRFLLRRADAVIAIGETMRRRLIDEKGAKPETVAVIHNWADCALLRPDVDAQAFARTHGLSGRFVVMHAGNIGLSQNLDIVLAAAEELRDHDAIRFVFIGDGARRAALELAARNRGLDNILFLPYQPRGDMSSSYAAADVFLISLKEGLAGYIVPSKLYSILAAGKPYVAAVEAASEVAEITNRYGCGVVVAPGDGKELAVRILGLYGDPSMLIRLGQRARQAGLMFDRPRQVSAYASLLNQIARAAGFRLKPDATLGEIPMKPEATSPDISMKPEATFKGTSREIPSAAAK